MEEISSSIGNKLYLCRTNGKSYAKNHVITLKELSVHDSSTDCWIVIYDRVYDCTEFLKEHPGGYDVLLEYAGRDASVAFRNAGHTSSALLSLQDYFIGELPLHEQIFRKPGGYRLSNIPD